MIEFIWGTNSYGKAKPLFGIRTTNGVEGENNALLQNDFRNQTVSQAIFTYIARCSEGRMKMESKIRILLEQNVNVTKRAISFINGERQYCSGHEVLKCGYGNDLYNGINTGKTTSTLVDLKQKTCARCPVRHQMILPCRHVLCVLNYLKQKRTMDFVHPAYKLLNIQQCISNLEFVIPTSYQLLPPPFSTIVEPPPRYNMNNKEILEYIQGPGRKQVRIHASTGDFRGGKTSKKLAASKFRAQCDQDTRNNASKNISSIFTPN
jgi:hypothetical protein